MAWSLLLSLLSSKMAGSRNRCGQKDIAHPHTHHPPTNTLCNARLLPYPPAHPFILSSLHNPCSRSPCLAPRRGASHIQSWGGSSSTKEATPKVRGWEWPAGVERVSQGKQSVHHGMGRVEQCGNACAWADFGRLAVVVVLSNNREAMKGGWGGRWLRRRPPQRTSPHLQEPPPPLAPRLTGLERKVRNTRNGPGAVLSSAALSCSPRAPVAGGRGGGERSGAVLSP